MEKKRWGCSFLSVNTLIHRVGALLAVSTLLVLGTSTPLMAKCDFDTMCEKGENAKNCSDCRVQPPPASGLKANLTGGPFLFATGALPIVLNAKQTEATSSEDVVMNRPPDPTCSGSGEACMADIDCPGTETCDPNLLSDEWDCVFLGGADCGTNWDGCKLLSETPDPLMFEAWRIFFGAADGGGLRLNLLRSLQMIGVMPDYSLPGQTIPPSPNQRSVFTLEEFILSGDNIVSGTRPRITCEQGPGSGGSLERFRFETFSYLTICGGDVDPNDCHP